MNDNAQKAISALERENAALVDDSAAVRVERDRLVQENRLLTAAIERLVHNAIK